MCFNEEKKKALGGGGLLLQMNSYRFEYHSLVHSCEDICLTQVWGESVRETDGSLTMTVQRGGLSLVCLQKSFVTTLDFLHGTISSPF